MSGHAVHSFFNYHMISVLKTPFRRQIYTKSVGRSEVTLVKLCKNLGLDL